MNDVPNSQHESLRAVDQLDVGDTGEIDNSQLWDRELPYVPGGLEKVTQQSIDHIPSGKLLNRLASVCTVFLPKVKFVDTDPEQLATDFEGPNIAFSNHAMQVDPFIQVAAMKMIGVIDSLKANLRVQAKGELFFEQMYRKVGLSSLLHKIGCLQTVRTKEYKKYVAPEHQFTRAEYEYLDFFGMEPEEAVIREDFQDAFNETSEDTLSRDWNLFLFPGATRSKEQDIVPDFSDGIGFIALRSEESRQTGMIPLHISYPNRVLGKLGLRALVKIGSRRTVEEVLNLELPEGEEFRVPEDKSVSNIEEKRLAHNARYLVQLLADAA